jgi:sugar (pentulose or hexulose) kinase
MNSLTEGVVIGVDVGTSGVRALAATAEGEVLADARAALIDLPAAGSAHEQDANGWWRAVCNTLQDMLKTLRGGQKAAPIAGIAVTSTSGSLVLADSQGRPVRAAMLYDDGRAGAVANLLNAKLSPSQDPINASHSLAKALWVRQEEPAVWAHACHILHPADWLTGKLTGQFGVTDYSNALKLGYEPQKRAWAEAVERAEIPASMLPRMVAPGEQVGTVSLPASHETGLASGVPVLAGASDGLASLVGSGASQAGHANTTLGTTLVWKVLCTSKPQLGPGMYCHLHPSHLWAPGAASNTGPGSLRMDDPTLDAAEMDRRAASYLPSSTSCFLLGKRGERFPFLNPQAQAFVDGKVANPNEWHAAQLQSLACVERWGYERLQACGVQVGDEVFSAGSAAASPVLSQLRANVLNRNVVLGAHPTASFGAAILAAGTTFYAGEVAMAIRRMTRVVQSHGPQPDAVGKFADAYHAFRAACARRGYD